MTRVVNWFRAQPDSLERFGSAIRRSLDEVFDGQRTGRYRIDQLSKVEKSYIGTKLEIIVQDEFSLTRGTRMDYNIAGEEVDAKWSMRFGGWMIPTEAIGELCVCITADDEASSFSVGLIRVGMDNLRASTNKDSKRQLSPTGRESMTWLARGARLLENLLLHLEDVTRDAILDRSLSGQRRINELFHRVQERIIRREVVLTVAQQDDGPKRVRDARKALAEFGVAILGHQGDHPEAARRLGIAVPRKGEWISVSVADAVASDPAAVMIGGIWKRPLFAPPQQP